MYRRTIATVFRMFMFFSQPFNVKSKDTKEKCESAPGITDERRN